MVRLSRETSGQWKIAEVHDKESKPMRFQEFKRWLDSEHQVATGLREGFLADHATDRESDVKKQFWKTLHQVKAKQEQRRTTTSSNDRTPGGDGNAQRASVPVEVFVGDIIEYALVHKWLNQHPDELRKT